MNCAPATSASLQPAIAADDCWLDASRELAQRDQPLIVRGDHGQCGFSRDWRFPLLGEVFSSRWGAFFFLGLPRLDAAHAQEGARDLLLGLRHAGAAVAEFAAVPAHGPVMRTLHDVARRENLPMSVMARWRRAALDATQSVEQWWRADVSRKRRKEWKRLKRKLDETGDVRFETLRRGGDLAPWLNDFLKLEQAGWKGKRGTAIACDRHQTAFVKQALACFHRQGRLRFWRLVRDDTLLATMFGFIDGATLWLGKIAHDETMGRYSPGLLLTIEATRDILADPAVSFADSAADPDHPMIDHVWKQRLEMADVLIATRPMRAARWRAIVAAELLRRAARARAKRLYHALRA